MRRAYKTPDGWDTSSGNGGHGSFHREGREDGQTGYVHKRNRKGAPNGVTSARPKYNESFDAAVTDLVDARNKRSVWTIPTQSYPEAHFATFPEALVEPCILAGSRLGDIVLDPFMGSGTTARVAELLGRRWIGIELNEDYRRLQEDRLQITQALPL